MLCPAWACSNSRGGKIRTGDTPHISLSVPAEDPGVVFSATPLSEDRGDWVCAFRYMLWWASPMFPCASSTLYARALEWCIDPALSTPQWAHWPFPAQPSTPERILAHRAPTSAQLSLPNKWPQASLQGNNYSPGPAYVRLLQQPDPCLVCLSLL